MWQGSGHSWVPDGAAGIQNAVKFVEIDQSKNIMLRGLMGTVVIIVGQTGEYGNVPVQTIRLGNDALEHTLLIDAFAFVHNDRNSFSLLHADPLILQCG